MPGDEEKNRGVTDPVIIKQAAELKNVKAQLTQNTALIAKKEALLTQALQDKSALEGENTKLKNELAQKAAQVVQKEALLTQAFQAKAALEGENANLKNEVIQKAAQIQSFEREKAQIIEKYQKLSATDHELLEEKETKIVQLNAHIEELSSSRGSDELLVKELTNTRLQVQQLDMQNKFNTQTLIESKAALNISEEQVRKMTLDLEHLNKLVADFQLDKATAKNELELLRTKIKSAYTPEELSAYLSSAIDSFNSQVNVTDPSVNYVINGMDVDLKTQVYKDDQSRVMFTPADITSKSENSLSSIKISIRAVPRL